MSVSDLTEQEQAVVYDCLRAAAEGPFFAEREFGALFGMGRSDVCSVMRAWPRVSAGRSSPESRGRSVTSSC